jgi:hypothetical protein
VKIIGQMLINILSSGWRNKGSYHEVDIGEQKEGGDGKRGADGRVPLLRVAVHGERVEVEVDESCCYEDVDHRKRIRDQTVTRLVSSG